MIISKLNIHEFVENVGGEPILDITTRKGKMISGIEYLPENLVALHLGSNFSMKVIPKLPKGLRYFSVSSPSVTSLEEFPPNLHYISLLGANIKGCEGMVINSVAKYKEFLTKRLLTKFIEKL